MEGVALEHFNKLKPSTIPMEQLRCHLSDGSDQDYSTTVTHIFILIKFLLTKNILALFLTTMWYHTDGCANQYRCASAIYLLSCLSVKFCFIIDRPVGTPGNVKHVIDGLNARGE